MPLTDKGDKIMANMKSQYGDKKGESVFYASKNKGTISGVDDGDMVEGDEADDAGMPEEVFARMSDLVNRVGDLKRSCHSAGMHPAGCDCADCAAAKDADKKSGGPPPIAGGGGSGGGLLPIESKMIGAGGLVPSLPKI